MPEHDVAATRVVPDQRPDAVAQDVVERCNA